MNLKTKEKQKMKTQKLFVIAAIVCFLVGVSSAAMAEGCADGLIQNETFDGNLRITDDSCTIMGSTIAGNLRIINSDYVMLLNNKVGGTLRVDGNAGNGVANVVANTVFTGQLVVRDMETANVIENETLKGDIRVIRNIGALVQKNIAAQDLRCNNTNTDAFFNFAGGALAECE
jgi:hypothetical protein